MRMQPNLPCSNPEAAFLIHANRLVDVEVAIRMLVAFAGERKGDWLCIPYVMKETDVYPQQGYIGFRCRKGGSAAEEGIERVIANFGEGDKHE